MVYVIIALVAVMAIIKGVAFFIAGTIVRLNRQPIPKNPKDYGMEFEPVEFETSDKVLIKGWLIKGSSDKLIIQTHVGGLTKYGSTQSYKNLTKLYNKEIEFLKTVRHLYDKGYSVLMFDFRNHGESGPSPNKGMAAIGLEEYRDVAAAMDFVKSRKDLKGKAVGFVSFCMGANSTIIAMSKEPDKFKEVKCLFAIQPISMEVFIRTYAKKLMTPVGAALLLPFIKIFVQMRSGYRLQDMSPKDYVKDLKVPTLYVQARNDSWTDHRDIGGFFKNTPEPKEFFWIEDTKHRFESYKYFQDKPEKMLEWLEKWM